MAREGRELKTHREAEEGTGKAGVEPRRPEPSPPERNPASARAVLEPAAVEAEARRITALIRGGRGEAKRGEKWR